MQQWYVVHTKPRMEEVAIENLERQGYSTYRPTMAKSQRRRNRWQKINIPLFPRYLFVQLAAGVDCFSPVRSTIGVHDIVRFGSRPAMLHQHLIETIRLQEASIHSHTSSHPKWKTGDKLEVIDGPFSGLIGVFEKENDNERVAVLLNLLGNANQISINVNHVVPLSEYSFLQSRYS